MIIRLSFKYLFALAFALLASSCKTNSTNLSSSSSDCKSNPSKINGISLVNTSDVLNQSDVEDIKSVNANWITTMPFAFVEKGEAEVKYGSDYQWYGETPEGVVQIIKLLKENDFPVMIKPHIWVMGSWVGEISFATEKEWMLFEETYTAYILTFAELAEQYDAELLCVGVELKLLVKDRPEFFPNLIKKVRNVYSGKLTYAANWDSYQEVQFWDDLDYIGIDAYFPLSEEQDPDYKTIIDSWTPYRNKIEKLAKVGNKKVLFTEFGYRNIDYATKDPWDSGKNSSYNEELQRRAYRAVFCTFWGEPWFAGGFLWKWFPASFKEGKNNRFTPQDKLAEDEIRRFFSVPL